MVLLLALWTNGVASRSLSLDHSCVYSITQYRQDFLPDHVPSLVAAVLVKVVLDQQVTVGVVGRHVVRDDSARDTKGSGN